ncbi:hypothetical protein LWI29_025233 [Acer saccharum]|uniref:Uncharacterized protein n=1 Tax=Acer saccharum TaxID=4024 RepID=A0AA39RT32_ACESA|nr:hypothetical protein LWI29_025233 [Acer saccharum]
MIENVSDQTMDQLELIDTLQRLGVSYHFVTEIEKILEKVYINRNDVTWKKENLYAVSLEFRVLRQHGYNVPQVGGTFWSWGETELCQEQVGSIILVGMGTACEPQFGYCRSIITKAISLITIIDDIYGVYGTFNELELFADAVDRLTHFWSCSFLLIILVIFSPADGDERQNWTTRDDSLRRQELRFGFVISLICELRMGEIYTRQAKCMKEKVRAMIENVSDQTMDQLELIDTLQRLGVSYHFVTEIEKILEKVYINRNDVTWKKENLYAVSLEFRVLRQHGYNVPQEVFNSFINEKGNFKVCLCDDINRMLSLYEASYYGLEGEIIMEEAWQFTTKHFKSFLVDR